MVTCTGIRHSVSPDFAIQFELDNGHLCLEGEGHPTTVNSLTSVNRYGEFIPKSDQRQPGPTIKDKMRP